MHTLQSDKNARAQQQLQNSPLPKRCCNSQNVCSKRLNADKYSSSCNESTQNSTTRSTTNLPPFKQFQNLLQRCCSVLLLKNKTTFSRISNRLCSRSSQLRPRHVALPSAAGYQLSSTAVIGKKNTITTKRSVIANCSIFSSWTQQLYLNNKSARQLTRSPSLVLLTLLLVWFSHLIGSSFAAPQSCVHCDISNFKEKAPNMQAAYEEYHFEHQVTRLDAITALKTFNVSDYGEPSGCAINCSDKVMKYCLGQQFINDHCWCELGHTEEGLPFVPHICYVGEKLYKATVGSCFFYEQVKECCCAPVLAKQWRYISVAARQVSTGSLLLLAVLLTILNVASRYTVNV